MSLDNYLLSTYILKPVAYPPFFLYLNGGSKSWDFFGYAGHGPSEHCYRWLLLGVLNQQLCPPPFIPVVLRAIQWVTHWWNRKLHLNGVKVYFLCNYQWVTHWIALSYLACSSRHPPRPNHFLPVFKGQGTKLTNFVFKIFQISRHFELVCAHAHTLGHWTRPKPRHLSFELEQFKTLLLKLCEF